MIDSTIKTIYALKSGNKSFDEAVVEYWSKHTGCPVEYYNEKILMRIAREVFLDYIHTADNPRYEVWSLFENMKFDCRTSNKSEDNFYKRVRNAIWATLVLTNVKNNNGFVNGFRDV